MCTCGVERFAEQVVQPHLAGVQASLALHLNQDRCDDVDDSLDVVFQLADVASWGSGFGGDGELEVECQRAPSFDETHHNPLAASAHPAQDSDR